MQQLYSLSAFLLERIALQRLDDVGEEIRLDRLDLIKLDIERHEDEFLHGGADIINCHLPSSLWRSTSPIIDGAR
jgi:FkbM family methyltransferase